MPDRDNCQERPGYYAVIPADVRYDTKLPPNAKLLYGEISALISKDGFCYAGNSYFAGIYSMTVKSISRLISSLEDAGYIVTQVDRDKTGKVVCRRIYLKVSLPDIQPVDNFGDTPPQDCPEGMDKKEEYTNTSNTNRKPAPGKPAKPSLTDDQLKALAVNWITAHGAAWQPSAKNALYAALLGFYEPRATKRDNPSRTKAAFTALGNRLAKYGGQDPEVMIEMLDLATSSGWKSVYPLKENQATAEPEPQKKERWL